MTREFFSEIFTFPTLLFATAVIILFLAIHVFIWYKSTPRRNVLRLLVRNSHYMMVHEGNSDLGHYYVDLDEVLLSPDATRNIINSYSGVVDELLSKDPDVTKLAFIEGDSGPVGAVVLAGALVDSTGLPGVIVRLRRRLVDASVKGALPIERTDRFIVISDVATSGAGVVEAVQKLRHLGGQVTHAVVFHDRQQYSSVDLSSATERLANLAPPVRLVALSDAAGLERMHLLPRNE